jgi:uncharacterized pyridoxamine 5'-phosphate oxidase family protein
MFMDNFEVELEKIFKKFGESKLVAVATCNQNIPTVRTMSVIFYNRKFYCQTGTDLMKYKQICENKNVALCFENIQIEGVANIMGKPIEYKEIMELYKKYYKSSFEKYSKLDKEILIEIVPLKIIRWDYDNDGKPYRIFVELEKRKVYKEMYLD